MGMGAVKQLFGHLWTIGPSLRHRARPWTAPPARPWSTTLQDPEVGALELQGALHRHEDRPARGLCVAIHGLGGSIDSHYMIRTARAALAAGLDCLRLALRGADRLGADFYHAALTADVEAALRSPALADYRDLFVVGYSLGGHLALSHGLAPSDPRLRAVASVCAPLDLAAAGAAIDHPRAAVYCGHVLSGLKQIYTEVARRRPVPTPLASVLRVRTIRAWDRLAVVPRFGFASVDDYYQRASIGPRLAGVQVPALVLSARADPMIPAATIAPHVADLPELVTHLWLDRGGHVGFPGGLELGLGEAPPGLAAQVIGWLQQQA
jgi:predicted alpha/beta-fold hydrolase